MKNIKFSQVNEISAVSSLKYTFFLSTQEIFNRANSKLSTGFDSVSLLIPTFNKNNVTDELRLIYTEYLSTNLP